MRIMRIFILFVPFVDVWHYHKFPCKTLLYLPKFFVELVCVYGFRCHGSILRPGEWRGPHVGFVRLIILTVWLWDAYFGMAWLIVRFLYESDFSNVHIARIPVSASGKTAKPPAYPIAPWATVNSEYRKHPGLLLRHARVPPLRRVSSPFARVYTTSYLCAVALIIDVSISA